MLKYNLYKPTESETTFISNILNIEPNDISYLFFNDKNINYINDQLIIEIMKITKERYGKSIKIQSQQKHILIACMRHIYFTHIRNTFPAEQEVDMLNEQVIKRLVKTATTELIAYLRYIDDWNTINPLPLPIQDNKRAGNLGSFSKMFNF